MALRSGIQLPRNTLYRERRVKIELTTGTVIPGSTVTLGAKPATILTNGIKVKATPGKKVKIPDTLRKVVIDLTEVATISISSAGSTAVANGVISNILQPWYFGPVVIEMTGKSYMGAFANDSLNVAVDNDITQLLLLRQFVNEAFLLARSTLKDLQARIFIGKPGQSNLGLDTEFIGFVDDLRIDEGEDAPYIQTYQIKFTGEISSAVMLSRGEEGARFDKKSIQQPQTASVATTKPAPKPPIVVERADYKLPTADVDRLVFTRTVTGLGQ